MRARNTLNVFEAGPEHAPAVVEVIHRSFAARPPVDPPATALDETAASVAAALERSGGLLVERRGVAMGTMLFDDSRPGQLGLRRVSVDPRHQNRGVASAMVGVAEDIAEERGLDGVWLHVREELPEMIEFWERRKYIPVGREGTLLEYGKTLWLARELPDVAATQDFATRLAALVRPGDVLVLTGDLGAGKTTFTQAFGTALGVRGPITSPTFVLARSHPSLGSGPSLVHVDAYRLGDAAELDDLDLDASLEDAVTVIEWGEGKAEQLSSSWLHLRLEHRVASIIDPLGTQVGELINGDEDPREQTWPPPDPEGMRVLTIRSYGARWVGVPLRSSLLPAGD